MTKAEIKVWRKKIDNMSQVEMARMWRFAPPGHPVFTSDSPLFDYFKKRFEKMGGMTPQISKKIGWER